MAAVEKTAITPTAYTRWSGDVFRSRLLDKFAEVECWAVGRLRAADPDKKLQPTLGLRLGAVRKLTDTHPALFKQATTTAKLLDELRPYQDLRSTLAHSRLSRGRTSDDKPVYIFEPPYSAGEMHWRGRITLEETDFREILNRVSEIANRLDQQTRAAD